MQTIERKCLARRWILAKAAQLAPVEPIQLERCILAFELLGRIADSGIPFIFKGGTAVLLRLKQLRRLSVDVDISSRCQADKLERTLTEIGRRPPFLGCEERQRRQPPLPKKRHFYFRFKSAITGEDGDVIADVLEEDDLYPVVEKVPVKMPFFNPDHRVLVRVPTVEGLLGDKLTAFAPTTVGLPYDAESPVDIIKQLFDIGQLFDGAGDLATVCDTYGRVFAAENHYRGDKFTAHAALDDTYEAALLLCSYDIAKITKAANAALLVAGVKNLRPLLVQSTFNMPEAKAAAAKAALLSRIVKQDRRSQNLDSLRFNPTSTTRLQSATLKNPYQFLTKLRGTTDEAFHYWHTIQSVFGAL